MAKAYPFCVATLLVAMIVRAAGVEIWQTHEGGGIATLPANAVHVGDEEAWMTPCVDLDAAKPSHPYLGLGGSFAEASCELLWSLPAEKRQALVELTVR